MQRVIARCALAVACGLLTGCGAGKAAQDKGPQALPVQTQVARLQPVENYTEYLATIQSLGSAVLQPDVEGQVVRIYVHSGERVSAGAPILAIDPSKQQASVHTEEATRRARAATLEYDRQQLERQKQLYAAGVISRQDLDQAQSAYDAAKADVEASAATVRQQEVQLHYYEVKAPAAGVVGDIPARVGDRVTNSTVLTTIDTGKELEAYLYVAAEKAGEVRLGTPVDLLDDNGKPQLRVKVTFVSPRLDPQTQLLLIKAAIPPEKQSQFRNQEIVHARVIWGVTEHPLVPLTAVSRLGGSAFVFVAEQKDGKTIARQRSVQLGQLVGNDYPVLDGLKPGEKIIVSGVQMLVDGMPVAPMG